MIHGFQDSGNASWVLNLKNNIFSLKVSWFTHFLNIDLKIDLKIKFDQESANFISVDWAAGAVASLQGGIYVQAALNTKIVGSQTAYLLSQLKVNLSNVHCVGHSLGAHCKKNYLINILKIPSEWQILFIKAVDSLELQENLIELQVDI